MKIFVMRHGTTPLNKEKKVNGQINEPLAPEGIREAKTIISLIPKEIRHIYASPLLRTRQTAEIINSKIHLPISIQDELTEINMGSLAGKSWEEMESGMELKKLHRSVQFDYRQYGGESADDVKKRVLNFFKKISGKHNDYESLIVTHGGIIRIINLLERGEVVYETFRHDSLLEVNIDSILKNSY